MFYLSVHGSITGVYFGNIVWLKICYNTIQSVVHADKGIVVLKWVLKSEFYSEQFLKINFKKLLTNKRFCDTI